MKKVAFPALIVAIVAVMIGVFVLGQKYGPSTSTTEPERLGTKHKDEGNTHVPEGTKVEYKTDLPSSGNHYPSPTPWGIKEGELADEIWVHNLEHGGVMVAYKACNDSVKQDCVGAGELKELKAAVRDFKPSRFNNQKFVLMPRSKNTHKVQLAAWTYTLNLDSLELNTIKKFYESHLDKGPELVP